MSDTTIAAQVEEMNKEGAENPDPRMEAFGREVAALAEMPVPADAATAGTVLPDAELIDVDGTARTLGDEVGESLSVLVFYRGAWCPFCNIALRTYQSELLPVLRARGVPLIAVSPQKSDGSLTMKEKHDLKYAVLSDPGLVLARAANVIGEPTEESVAAQAELGLDLTEVNADGTLAVPLPTVAILDADRTIRWIEIHTDYTKRSEPADILAALDELEGR